MSKRCKKITIRGIVQGVGFRPFVYGLAIKHALKGSVENTGSGVVVIAQGNVDALAAFERALRSEAPPLSRIDEVLAETVTCKDYAAFEIIESSLSSKSTAISPDIALCDACLREMNDPANRRSGYFLINCTHCGPRYSIMKTLPYDRHNTSMASFTMCKACKSEYDNPLNRRYHAQPISCNHCGPQLHLYASDGTLCQSGSEVIVAVAKMLRDGHIVAFKGIGGFHLMCDATNNEALSQLRARKRRKAKPFALLCHDLECAERLVTCNAYERTLLSAKERPVVLLQKRADTLVSDAVAPGIDRLGIMLAYAPLQHLLFEHFKGPLVATSANFSDEPIYRNKEQIFAALGGVIDAVVDVAREIINAVDDSVVQGVDGQLQMLRMGRGYAPLNIRLPFTCKQPTLAVGAQQKNAIALMFEDTLILSPHIGDLGSIEADEYFERTLATFKRLYDFEPEVIVCDAHPNYATTQWAKKQNKTLLEVQHHHAHVLACMLEHQLDEAVLAFAFDGTGYGSDGTIWGGEVLRCEATSCERLGHVAPFRLIGGERAVKEPKRVALGLLFESFGRDAMDALDLPLMRQFDAHDMTTLHQAWSQGLNAPLCSSMGRLFDAVASLMDLLHVSLYEGQSGLMMEALCHDEDAVAFTFHIEAGLIDITPMIREIVAAVHSKESHSVPDRFINTLVAIMDVFAAQHPELPVVLTGGVFQNKTLCERTLRHFKKQNRRCYIQNHTPINDGAIALGQAAFALYYQGAL